MNINDVWPTLTALVAGVTSKGAFDYYNNKRRAQSQDRKDIIQAKDEFIQDLQSRYLRLEERLTELHDDFISSEKDRSELKGRVYELEARVHELEQEVEKLEGENAILNAENKILKNK